MEEKPLTGSVIHRPCDLPRVYGHMACVPLKIKYESPCASYYDCLWGQELHVSSLM